MLNSTSSDLLTTVRGVDGLLADARARLDRVTAVDAASMAATDERVRLVDVRPQWQRARSGEIPGAWVVELVHLEWRLDPASDSRIADALDGRYWIVICDEGYSSSLAADRLNRIGVDATDVIDGFNAWVDVGLPVVAGELTPPDHRVPVRPPSVS
jgi:rhodanese-related sulfurtransferase